MNIIIDNFKYSVLLDFLKFHIGNTFITYKLMDET